MPRDILVPSPGEGGDLQPLLARAIADAGPGDAVILPAGNFWLEGGLEVKGRNFKPLTLLGQGKNRTRLFKRGRNRTARFMIAFEGQSDPSDRIEVVGVAFEGAPQAALDEKIEHDDIGLRLTRCPGFTVRGCRFTSFGHAAVQVRHALQAADGLIYNNEFIDNHHPNPRPDPVPGRRRVSSLGYGVEVRADPASVWVPDPPPGSSGFVFIEDNYFAGHRHAVAGGGGGLYVFRHNLVDRSLTAHAVDAHGAGKHGNDLSTRFYEVYCNTLVRATSREAGAGGFTLPNFAMAFRGGEGVVFENTTRGFPTGVRLAVEVPAPGYPVPYQIGWESAINHTPNPDPDHRGVVPPEWGRGDVFLWSNRFVGQDGEPVAPIHIGPNERHLLIEDRDYHRIPRPNYEPFAYPHPRATAQTRLAFPYPLAGDFDSRLASFFNDASNDEGAHDAPGARG
jgi:hypothetical protein